MFIINYSNYIKMLLINKIYNIKIMVTIIKPPQISLLFNLLLEICYKLVLHMDEGFL
jgi:hypothetical protein